MHGRRTPDATAAIALLKPSELAAQLGVSRTWLYDAAKDGRIPSIRIGGADGPLRFVPQDIERWIDDARAGLVPSGGAQPVGRPC
jgi:excisionase family DNA binding protein